MAYSTWSGTSTYVSLPVYGSHTHSISPSWENHTVIETPKEKPMSTLEKIKQQRQEERERGRIERMYAEYDESGLSGVDVGTVATFTFAPDEEHSYRYAALFSDDEKWYLTGGRSIQGVGYEDFVAWLIEKDIEAADLTWWDAS